MICLAANQQPIICFTQPNHQPQIPLSREKRSDRIVLAEHRDEVFARLASDLRQCGYTVFRASSVDDVCRMYTYGEIELVLFNFQLPCDDARLKVRKLRVFDAYSRIWLYVPFMKMLRRHHADLHRIERVVEYDGDVFQLVDQIRANLDGLPLTRSVCNVSSPKLQTRTKRRSQTFILPKKQRKWIGE